jgi:hypothetical protein
MFPSIYTAAQQSFLLTIKKIKFFGHIQINFIILSGCVAKVILLFISWTPLLKNKNKKDLGEIYYNLFLLK